MNALQDQTNEFKLSDDEFFCTDIEQGEYLRCKSRMFEFEGGCYARALMGEGFMAIRLDLPSDHPAVEAAREDVGPTYAEVMEIEDIVPVSDLERPDGRPIRVWKRSLTSSERAARARKAGYKRPKLDELDYHLYSKYLPQGRGSVR